MAKLSNNEIVNALVEVENNNTQKLYTPKLIGVLSFGENSKHALDGMRVLEILTEDESFVKKYYFIINKVNEIMSIQDSTKNYYSEEIVVSPVMTCDYKEELQYHLECMEHEDFYYFWLKKRLKGNGVNIKFHYQD